ncbi:hypothetical protein [Streptomyces sp. NBC_00285]|uniref:hypothetical protein n=1 Tax=Streptomyces sp. NBC_00285 TaxID=2975700 RepID=UPI003FA791AA
MRLGPRRALAVFAPAAVAVTVFGAPTADAATQPMQAAGLDKPDLAMVVTGGSGRTKALRSDEPDFARLWQLLQPTYTGTERVSDAWEEGRYPSVRITVVWELTGVGGWPQTNAAPGGDVAVERQDQLFLAADGTPWVRTDPAPEQEDDDIRWHRAPRAVFDRLDRAGLLGGGEVEGAGEPGGLAGDAWWALPGLAVGFAAGAGGTRLIRRATARPGAGPPREGPRQELIDL